nr:RecName: Full=Uncharacterized protein IMPP19 [Nautilus macromphalus]
GGGSNFGQFAGGLLDR